MKNIEKTRQLLNLLAGQGNQAIQMNISMARVFATAVAMGDGVTQSDIAKALDIPIATVSRIVRSLKPPKVGLWGFWCRRPPEGATIGGPSR